MNTLSCNRLLINDTRMPQASIETCIGRLAPEQSIRVVSGYELWDRLSETAIRISRTVETIVLPWNGADIFAACTPLDIPPVKTVRVQVSRKLAGLSPRWLDISPADADLLGRIDGPYSICDDVVASGTTINGIYKRTKSKTATVLTLVCRTPNEIRSNLPVVASLYVSRPDGGRPAINTLSTLTTDTIKSQSIYADLTEKYGENFAKTIRELFFWL